MLLSLAVTNLAQIPPRQFLGKHVITFYVFTFYLSISSFICFSFTFYRYQKSTQHLETKSHRRCPQYLESGKDCCWEIKESKIERYRKLDGNMSWSRTPQLTKCYRYLDAKEDNGMHVARYLTLHNMRLCYC